MLTLLRRVGHALSTHVSICNARTCLLKIQTNRSCKHEEIVSKSCQFLFILEIHFILLLSGFGLTGLIFLRRNVPMDLAVLHILDCRLKNFISRGDLIQFGRHGNRTMQRQRIPPIMMMRIITYEPSEAGDPVDYDTPLLTAISSWKTSRYFVYCVIAFCDIVFLCCSHRRSENNHLV